LALREVQSLLVEGGSQIHGAFIAAGLVDSVAIFLAPRLVGSGVPVVEGRGLDWRKPATLGPLSVRALGEDLLLTADVVTRGQRRRP
jgi:diaminohydroxyphosphoribosylaminopyrimidine deaminase/5-amino-6-(5-phosphoribosylamino)uracil reductase